jgi:hypothetical protein
MRPEFHTAIRMSLLNSSPEDGGNMYLRNVGIYLQVHTALQPKDQHRQRVSRIPVKLGCEQYKLLMKMFPREQISY